MEFNTEERDRGQVGIGTLIVFIAMVLVAAIAAGVLINTAGFLQERGQQAGEESGEQVTNRIQLQSAYSSNVDGSGVNTMKVTGSLAPGSETVDLTDVTIQYIGPSGVDTLTHAGSASDGTNFGETLVKNNDGSADVLNEPSDVVEITLDPSNDLSFGDSAEVRVTTASNGESIMVLNAPSSASGESVVQL